MSLLIGFTNTIQDYCWKS